MARPFLAKEVEQPAVILVAPLRLFSFTSNEFVVAPTVALALSVHVAPLSVPPHLPPLLPPFQLGLGRGPARVQDPEPGPAGGLLVHPGRPLHKRLGRGRVRALPEAAHRPHRRRGPGHGRGREQKKLTFFFFFEIL